MAERSAVMMKGGVGGLHGVIPTRDLPAARRAFLEYVQNFTGPDEDRLDFAQFAVQWKRRQQ